jgi:hypothetical protein
MEGLLYSRGWSCGESPAIRRNHRHHPYWRFDFDVETVANEVNQFRTPASGPTSFVKRTVEGQDTRLSTDQLFGVRVSSTASTKHINAYVAQNELRDASGSPWFSFSNRDIAWRLYRSSEDNGLWADFRQVFYYGALLDLGWDSPAENIDRKDVVIWLVAHMSHKWDGRDPAGVVWHSAGPTITLSW